MRTHRRWLRSMVPAMIAGWLVVLAGAAAGESPGTDPRALPLVGFDFRISGAAATAAEWNPAVAHNPTTNQYLAVWEDSRNDEARSADIYGRRLAADGSPIGGDFRISGPAATADDGDPAVAYNPSTGQFLVVWVDGRNLATRGSDIYGQRVAANGSLVGSNFRVGGPNADGQELSPALAYNSCTTQYLVVWQDRRNPLTRGYDVYGQQVAADGSRVGADFRISGPAATAGDWMPAVAYSTSANQYLVVWFDERNLSTRGYDIYGQLLAFDGSSVGGNFRISGAGATAGERHPAVVHNSTANQYLVVWSDGRNETLRGFDIYGRKLAVDGSRIGTDFRISGAGATADEWSPALAFNSTAGQNLVAWSDGRNETTRDHDIYGRRVAG